MKKKVAVLGATGTVGQRICHMLRDHPWFDVSIITAGSSAGKVYGEAVNWLMPGDVPLELEEKSVLPSKPEGLNVDFAFSALPSKVAKKVEPEFAEAGIPVVSNASAFRMEEDVPLIVPEINPDHIELIENQRENRGWDGFITTDPNCSTINFVLALKPLQDTLSIRKVIVTTMQAISGAGYPGVPSLDILDNVIPYIGGEEEKMKIETLKVLGSLEEGRVRNAPFAIAASCNRVPVYDGHLESVYIEAEKEIDLDEVKDAFRKYEGKAYELGLPTAPNDPVILREERDRPQTRLDRMAGSIPGMSVTVGRLRHSTDPNSIQFSVLGHNTIRGAAGGAILVAELLASKGWID